MSPHGLSRLCRFTVEVGIAGRSIERLFTPDMLECRKTKLGGELHLLLRGMGLGMNSCERCGERRLCICDTVE